MFVLYGVPFRPWQSRAVQRKHAGQQGYSSPSTAFRMLTCPTEAATVFRRPPDATGYVGGNVFRIYPIAPTAFGHATLTRGWTAVTPARRDLLSDLRDAPSPPTAWRRTPPLITTDGNVRGYGASRPRVRVGPLALLAVTPAR